MYGDEMNFEYLVARLNIFIEKLESLKITKLDALHAHRHVVKVIPYHTGMGCEELVDKFISDMNFVVSEIIKERETQGKM